MVCQIIAQILMMANIRFGFAKQPAIIIGLLALLMICQIVLGGHTGKFRLPKNFPTHVCLIYYYQDFFFNLFSPIGKSTSIEDANNVNNWNVWNGVSWKPASDLTLVAVHILG